MVVILIHQILHSIMLGPNQEMIYIIHLYQIEKVGIGLNNPNGILEITNDNISKIKTGSLTSSAYFAINQILCTTFFRFFTYNTGNDIAFFWMW